MSFWNIRYCPLFKDPAPGTKVCDLPMGSILEDLEQSSGHYSLVLFRATKTFVGWVWKEYLEELRYKFPPENIAGQTQTPSKQDAAQYISYLGNVQYNLCGEMCVAWIFGEDVVAFKQTFLNRWRGKATGVFNRVFLGGKSRTTGIGDLISMASCYPCDLRSVQEALLDPKSNSILLSPGRLQQVLSEGWRGILGVKIEGRHGKLRANGPILHWVAVSEVFPDGINGGSVLLYNPFPDRCEEYSWNELVTAMGVPCGIFLRPRPNP